MTKLTKLVASLAIVGLAMAPLLRSARAQENQSPLTVATDEGAAHFFPTVDGARSLAPLLVPGPLAYNGGPIMPNVTTYAIFWVPPKLQDGTPTGMSPNYRPILKKFLMDYPAHGIDNNNTQYYQHISGITTYIHNAGKFGGAFVDTSHYPASGCTDSARPGGCLTDHQIQNEIKKVMALAGWTGGLNHMFLLFTSDGEGSCFTAASTTCAYVTSISNPGYCAYHGFFSTATSTVIYGNEPYGDLSVCQASSIPSPNGDAVADAAASTASHELTEATTDPLINAWYDASGFEIGDLCAYTYGSYTWGSSNANEMWNGDLYVLQMEYDNHAGGCVQVGP
jgi:hypothetical protein